MVREPWKITRKLFLNEIEVDKLRRFLAAWEKSGIEAATDRVIVETLIGSGLRNSELCSLRLQDAELSKRAPCLRVVGTPRQDRTVYISQSLRALLKVFIARIRPARSHGDADLTDPAGSFFISDRGRGYDRTSIYRRVVRVLAEAGFGSRARVQLLRHTYGYLAYRNTGGNLLFVQRQLGHAHPMVTAVYAEFVDESNSELADRADRGARRERPSKSQRKSGDFDAERE